MLPNLSQTIDALLGWCLWPPSAGWYLRPTHQCRKVCEPDQQTTSQTEDAHSKMTGNNKQEVSQLLVKLKLEYIHNYAYNLIINN